MIAVVFAPVPAEADAGDVYRLFDAVLSDRVDDGIVDYPAIWRDERFPDLLRAIADFRLQTLGSRAERLAFWVNTYNALVIKGILDGKSPGDFLGRYRFFKRTYFDVARQTLTLDYIEHQILRPMRDPRVHFALVCASSSCPKLNYRAYRPETIDVQFDGAARWFINDRSRNRFELEGTKAKISKVFEWFADDFAGHSGSVQKYLSRYVADTGIAGALRHERFAVDYLNYDWTLNGPPPPTGKGSDWNIPK